MTASLSCLLIFLVEVSSVPMESAVNRWQSSHWPFSRSSFSLANRSIRNSTPCLSRWMVNMFASELATKLNKWFTFSIFISIRVHDFATCHPSIGFTVAQLGPPSLPVPGIVACNNRFDFSSTESIISQVIVSSGILIRRCQQLLHCPADFPMSM